MPLPTFLFGLLATGQKDSIFPERLIGAQTTDKVQVLIDIADILLEFIFFPRSVFMTTFCLIWMSHIHLMRFLKKSTMGIGS
jgi:hypothetical protein